MAQVTSGMTSSASYNTFAAATPPSDFSAFNLQATDLSMINGDGRSGNESLQATGDWDLSLAPADVGQGDVYTEGYLPFTVGDVPVQMSNFEVTVNAKWVNGGGDAMVPATEAQAGVILFEQLGASPALGSDIIVAAANASQQPDFSVTLDGNGLAIYGPETTLGTPSTYVLAADRTYYLYVASVTHIDTTGFLPGNTPSITVTNEFGGTFGDSFSGMNGSFDWVEVPEPSTWALGISAAAGVAAFGWFKRRRSWSDRL